MKVSARFNVNNSNGFSGWWYVNQKIRFRNCGKYELCSSVLQRRDG